jgi:hypothetical protein
VSELNNRKAHLWPNGPYIDSVAFITNARMGREHAEEITPQPERNNGRPSAMQVAV